MSQSSLIFELFMLKCHEIARKYNKYPRNLKIFSKNKESLKVTKSRTYLTIMNTHKITKTHFRCIFGACDTKLNFRNNTFRYETYVQIWNFSALKWQINWNSGLMGQHCSLKQHLCSGLVTLKAFNLKIFSFLTLCRSKF